MEEYTLQHAGRSGPRLLEDILRFRLGHNKFNLTPRDASETTIAPLHFYPVTVKSPNIAYHEVTSTTVRLYSLLTDAQTKSCCHLYLELEYGAPLAFGELHNFHFQEQTSPTTFGPRSETYIFICSITAAKLSIKFMAQELSPEEIYDFDPSAIKERVDRYKQQNLEDIVTRNIQARLEYPRPDTCYSTLFQIISNPLSSPGILNISGANSVLNTRINVAILPRLHFQHDEAENVWIPPDVYDPKTVADCEIRDYLIRILHEVAFQIKIIRPRQPPFEFEQMNNTLANTLSADVYERDEGIYPPISHEVISAFTALGAIENFSDNLIMSRYDLQSMNDPNNTPYYFDALKAIAQHRKSEELEFKLMELMSLGVVSLLDLSTAYKKFDLKVSDNVDEDLLIAIFKQYAKDHPTDMEAMLDAMKTISAHIKSPKIDDFLQVDCMSLNDAYNTLGISQSIDNDEVIHLAYETKMQEAKPEDERLFRAALLMVAKSRQSDYLFTCYEKAVASTSPVMQLEHAYTLLGVNKDTNSDTLLAIFKLRTTDNSGEIIELREALGVIGRELKSKTIKSFLNGNVDEDAQGSKKWPVGLENIGNTCYLNSLLQYYFTITPLRDAVLGFVSEPLEEISNTAVEKKVGGRAVSQAEVKRSQEFVTNLAGLFQELISTKSSAIAPKRDLAYLALVPSWEDVQQVADLEAKNYDEDMSDVSDDLPQSSVIIHSDSLMTSTSAENIDVDLPITQSPIAQVIDINSDSDSVSSLEDAIMSPVASSPPDDPPPLPPRYEPYKSAFKDPKDLKDPIITVTSIEPSKQMADSSTRERDRKIDSTLFGRQQDVTECIGNVLFQLEAAFKPTGIDEDGEQLDIVKDLFYGKTKQTLASEKDGTNRREKTERFSSLLVDVADGPRDLYDALDSCFGEDIVKLEDGGDTRRTVTITQAPPILQVQVQRVQFDRVQGRAYKSNALLQFDETVYLDRYLECEDDPSMAQKRREVSDWRIEARRLKSRLAKLTVRSVSFGFDVRLRCVFFANYVRRLMEQLLKIV